MPFPLESFEQLQGFFWVFVRVSIIVFMLPLFGARGLPALWKVGMSVVMAMVLLPVVPAPPSYPVTLADVLLGVLSEALVGLVLGLGISGLLTEVTRLAGWAGITYGMYFVHLIFVFNLFAFLPFSKLAHMVYRTVALAYGEFSGRK